MKLKNKTIIITGATSGIGKATAQLCHQEGANVLVHGIDAQAGVSLVGQLGSRSHYVDANLVDPIAPTLIISKCLEFFGQIDGLVNNAAILDRSNLDSTDAHFFDRVMSVNVRAPMLLIKAARPHLLKSKGSVVNIGSINAYCGERALLAYSISKGALMTLSRNLSDALGPDQIRINHLNPGWILTPNEYQRKIRDGLAKDWPETLGAYETPFGQMITAENVARHIVFWLSSESAPISGSVLELNQYPFIGRNYPKE